MRVPSAFWTGALRLHAALDRVLAVTLALLMGGAVVNVLWQITSRYGLGDPSPWTDELARYLLVWFGVLGSAAALGRKAHLAVDLLPKKIPNRILIPLNIGVDFLVGSFSVAVLVFGGSRLLKMSFDLGQHSPAMGLPMGFVYAVIPIAGICMFSYSLHSLALKLRSEEASPDA